MNECLIPTVVVVAVAASVDSMLVVDLSKRKKVRLDCMFKRQH
jgi:hypothetical protein